MEQDSRFSPTILEGARRHPIVVASVIVGFAALGFVASRFVFDDWEAETAVLIEDPATSQIFDTGNQRQPQRYLASQVAIIESRGMAETVLDLVEGHDLSVTEIIEDRDVAADRETDLIRIVFQHKEPELAVSFANAYVDAYVEYREQATDASFDSALEGLRQSIETVDEELAEIDRRIEAVLLAGADTGLDEEQIESVRQLLQRGASEETAEQLGRVVSQLQALQLLRTLQTQDQALQLLLEQRSSVVQRLSELVVRRDQLQVDAALTSDGIVAINEAAEPERTLATGRAIAVGILLGAVVGSAIALLMTRRFRRFEHRTEPAMALGLPLLAEVPTFSSIRDKSPTPVLDDPSTVAAEVFRFVSNAVVARLNALSAQSGSDLRSVAVTSAYLDAGKSVVAMNAGLAAAAGGRSVLIFDADFGDPSLTRMLIGEGKDLKGITDVVAGTKLLKEVVVPITLGAGHQVDILTRGSQQISAVDFFRSPQIYDLFQHLNSKYDLIIIDTPPMLQVAYASTVVALADAVALVIPHEGRLQAHEELLDRLSLLGAETLGYVYNLAPRRAELFERSGSMLDPLGTGQPRSA